MKNTAGTKHETAGKKTIDLLWMLFLLLAWAGVLFVLFKTNGHLSVDEILHFQPESKSLAVLTMTGLFLLKSVDVIMHSGVLYAANGVMFSLPMSICLNIMETVLMITLTYHIGKAIGRPLVLKIREKYQKVKAFSDLQISSEFVVALLLRAAGIPVTVSSLYMGSSGFHYGSYLLGSVCGLLPQIAAYTLLGTAAGDLYSPAFRIAMICSVGVSVSAVLFSVVILHSRKKAEANRAFAKAETRIPDTGCCNEYDVSIQGKERGRN